MPFFKALKKLKDFVWTDESQKAFEELKRYMAESPFVAKPNADEALYLYLVIFDKAISGVLMKEEERIQKHVYYMSKVLHEVELNYSTIEKFVLAMITASRNLRPYFQAHKVEILMDQPLKNIIHSPKFSGRLIKLAIELGEFDIMYKPRRQEGQEESPSESESSDTDSDIEEKGSEGDMKEIMVMFARSFRKGKFNKRIFIKNFFNKEEEVNIGQNFYGEPMKEKNLES